MDCVRVNLCKTAHFLGEELGFPWGSVISAPFLSPFPPLAQSQLHRSERPSPVAAVDRARLAVGSCRGKPMRKSWGDVDKHLFTSDRALVMDLKKMVLTEAGCRGIGFIGLTYRYMG